MDKNRAALMAERPSKRLRRTTSTPIAPADVGDQDHHHEREPESEPEPRPEPAASSQPRKTKAQLEKKRIQDRESQRNVRQRTKDYISELEAKVKELESPSIISKLLDENSILRSKVGALSETLIGISSLVEGSLPSINASTDAPSVRQKAPRATEQCDTETVASSLAGGDDESNGTGNAGQVRACPTPVQLGNTDGDQRTSAPVPPESEAPLIESEQSASSARTTEPPELADKQDLVPPPLVLQAEGERDSFPDTELCNIEQTLIPIQALNQGHPTHFLSHSQIESSSMAINHNSNTSIEHIPHSLYRAHFGNDEGMLLRNDLDCKGDATVSLRASPWQAIVAPALTSFLAFVSESSAFPRPLGGGKCFDVMPMPQNCQATNIWDSKLLLFISEHRCSDLAQRRSVYSQPDSPDIGLVFQPSFTPKYFNVITRFLANPISTWPFEIPEKLGIFWLNYIHLEASPSYAD